MENIKLFRHFYKVKKELKQYTVYELEAILNYHNENGLQFIQPFTKNTPPQSSQLTKHIRIEKFRGLSRAKNITDYFRLRDTGNWKTCKQVTGLFKTQLANVYYGDDLIKYNMQNSVKNLVIFVYRPEQNRLIIDYYNNYYPKTKNELDNIVISYLDN